MSIMLHFLLMSVIGDLLKLCIYCMKSVIFSEISFYYFFNISSGNDFLNYLSLKSCLLIPGVCVCVSVSECV